MPTTFSLCGAQHEATIILTDQMLKHHQDMEEAEVKIGILFANSDNGGAVTLGGYPRLAKIKVVPLRDRVSKNYDAELLIDEEKWNDLSSQQRAACMDHELEHLRLVFKENEDTGKMELQRDDINRPKLKCIKADLDAGDCFRDIIGRHGEDAIEFYNLDKAYAFVKAALNGG